MYRPLWGTISNIIMDQFVINNRTINLAQIKDCTPYKIAEIVAQKEPAVDLQKLAEDIAASLGKSLRVQLTATSYIRPDTRFNERFDLTTYHKQMRANDNNGLERLKIGINPQNSLKEAEKEQQHAKAKTNSIVEIIKLAKQAKNLSSAFDKTKAEDKFRRELELLEDTDFQNLFQNATFQQIADLLDVIPNHYVDRKLAMQEMRLFASLVNAYPENAEEIYQKANKITDPHGKPYDQLLGQYLTVPRLHACRKAMSDHPENISQLYQSSFNIVSSKGNSNKLRGQLVVGPLLEKSPEMVRVYFASLETNKNADWLFSEIEGIYAYVKSTYSDQKGIFEFDAVAMDLYLNKVFEIADYKTAAEKIKALELLKNSLGPIYGPLKEKLRDYFYKTISQRPFGLNHHKPLDLVLPEKFIGPGLALTDIKIGQKYYLEDQLDAIKKLQQVNQFNLYNKNTKAALEYLQGYDTPQIVYREARNQPLPLTLETTIPLLSEVNAAVPRLPSLQFVNPLDGIVHSTEKIGTNLAQLDALSKDLVAAGFTQKALSLLSLASMNYRDQGESWAERAVDGMRLHCMKTITLLEKSNQQQTKCLQLGIFLLETCLNDRTLESYLSDPWNMSPEDYNFIRNALLKYPDRNTAMKFLDANLMCSKTRSPFHPIFRLQIDLGAALLRRRSSLD